MVYPISKRIAWFVFSLFTKRLEGLENLPPPPAILVANHESDFDGLLLYFLVTKHTNQKVFPIVTDERATNWFGDWLVHYFGGARVHSGAVAKCVDALKEGKYVLIFPEGQRTWTGKIETCAATGTGVIAILSKVPVVPVKVKTYSFYSRYMRRPTWKKEIEISFGNPQTFKGKVKAGRVDKSDAKKVIAKVMKSVSGL